MAEKDNKLLHVNDEIDLTSLLSVFLENFNLLLSVLLGILPVLLIYYITATEVYRSSSLIEIQNESQSFLPSNLSNPLMSQNNSLNAEVEVYKSNDTVIGAIDQIKSLGLFEDHPNIETVKSNLSFRNDSKSLITITLYYEDPEYLKYLLNALNDEFISDRIEFKKQSSAAGKIFIRQEIPRIKSLLKEAEKNLNDFKLSTNASDVIFDTNTRNFKLEQLRNRVNEIELKELELKEFYKENHPIYVTLTQQKNLILSQIGDIEDQLPNVPATQRTLENFKREVNIYSEVLKDLSSQELVLSMAEASEVSNVRIINEASNPAKISPRGSVFLFSLLLTLSFYVFLLVRHFLSDRINNLDAIIDYLGKNSVIGERPLISGSDKEPNEIAIKVADELLNKTIYEILHSDEDFSSICIAGSKKNVGKTEIAYRLFKKLSSSGKKVCLLDLDLRKGGLTLKYFNKNKEELSSIPEFREIQDNYLVDGNLFVPQLKIENPLEFFMSEDFKTFIETLKEDYDYVIADTPPWTTFVDANVISKLFNKVFYVIGNKISTFKDIDLFEKDIENKSKIHYFFNKFDLYYQLLWLKYQYPYYSRNYYYDYVDYQNVRSRFTIYGFSVQFTQNLFKKVKKWVESFMR